MKILQVTRRNIFDVLVSEKITWSGRLKDTAFLSRLYELQSLPSDDSRFKDAAGDIFQHREKNNDWEGDWVFYDKRFKLLTGDDEIFLRFLCETIHPIVRSDAIEAQRLCQLYNEFLRQDGFQLTEIMRISGQPVYAGRYVGIAATPGISAAKDILSSIDSGYISKQITRMETAIISDPALAIGTAKELIATCCKTILAERSVPFGKSADIPELVKLVKETLVLVPNGFSDDIVKRLISNLGMVGISVAELRNRFGTGHGKEAGTTGLSPRHARLAVGAASTLAVFLMETHEEQGS
jgi:hypothetical protein